MGAPFQNLVENVTPDVSLIIWCTPHEQLENSPYFEALSYLCDGSILAQFNSDKSLKNSFFWTNSFGKSLLIIQHDKNEAHSSIADQIEKIFNLNKVEEDNKVDIKEKAIILGTKDSIDKSSFRKLEDHYNLLFICPNKLRASGST